MEARQVWQVGALVVLLAAAAGCGRQPPATDPAEEHLYDLLRQGRHIDCLAGDGSGLALWARRVEGRDLRGVLLKEYDNRGAYGLIISARAGELKLDLPNRALRVHLCEGTCVGNDGTSGYFSDRVLSFPFTQSRN